MFTLYHELINEDQSEFLQNIRKKMQSQQPEDTQFNDFPAVPSHFNADVTRIDSVFQKRYLLSEPEVVFDVSDI